MIKLSYYIPTKAYVLQIFPKKKKLKKKNVKQHQQISGLNIYKLLCNLPEIHSALQSSSPDKHEFRLSDKFHPCEQLH